MNVRRDSRRRIASILTWGGLIGTWWSLLMFSPMLWFTTGVELGTVLMAVIAIQVVFISCILYGIYVVLTELLSETLTTQSVTSLEQEKQRTEP